MKKVLLASVCAVGVMLGSSFVNAGETELPPPPPPFSEKGEFPPHHFGHRPSPEMREKMEKKMAEELGLTEEQKTKAKEIREEGRKKVEPLMEQMKETREKMDELRKENMKEFEAILTPEQKVKLEKIKAEHMEKMKEKHKGKHKKDFFKKGKHKKGEHKKDVNPEEKAEKTSK